MFYGKETYIHGTTALSITTFSITTLSIVTFSIMTLETVMPSVVHAVSFTLYVANKPIMLSAIMLSVVMLSVIMLSVVAPYTHAIKQ